MDNWQGAPEGCTYPAHVTGRIFVKDGFIGRVPRRRQRWRCRDEYNAGDFHRFVPPVPRLESLEQRCLDCESHLDVAQGPNAARHYDFIAREVAAALMSVAAGTTYQEAALTARMTVAAQYRQAGRPLPWSDTGMTHGQTAADWVEVFTDVVLAGDEDDRWPDVVLLDSTSFWRRQQGRKVPAFHVLMAYGYDDAPASAMQPLARCYDEDGNLKETFDDLWATLPPPVVNGRLLRAVAYPRSDAASWTDFLGSWPGTPQVIVSDRAKEILAAHSDAWPAGLGRQRPEFVNCVWHLEQNLREALEEDLIRLNLGSATLGEKRSLARQHPLMAAVKSIFKSSDAYRSYAARVITELDYAYLRLEGQDGKLTGARRWLKDNELPMLVQQARRPFRPGPESTGPLEAEVDSVRSKLGRRAQVLRNRPRTNLMLRLVVAGRRGQVNERAWAEKIRVHLAERAGTASPQRRLIEPLRRSTL